jgi:anaerobic magnesium-protoporphyrin IX monomethyl ester cyclase
MKIDLVYPSSSTGSENYSSEPPLGPIALYSSLSELYRRDLRFLDSTILERSEIEKAIFERKANIVALSCTTYNYKNALRIAMLAKANGSFVVLGGIHITHRRDAILTKMLIGERPIDLLVTGYGESAFVSLLAALEKGRSFSEIQNLSYVKDGNVVTNPVISKRNGNDPLSVPLDYSKIDFKKYSENFKPYGNLSLTRIPGSIYTQRGCPYSGNRKCTFCSIEQMNPRRSPELFEQDLTSLITKYNVDHVRITDADFTMDIKHMSRIAEVADRVFKTTGKKPLFHCFARANEITEQKIDILKKLNVVSVLIGYESGSNKMLNVMQKKTTSEENLIATKILKNHGIDVICGGIVLGAEGESEQSLSETMQFIKDLKKIDNTGAVMATPLIPLPGSICFSRLMNDLSKTDPKKYSALINADDFDLEELIELWNIYNCKVSVSRLIEVCNEIENFFPVGIRLIKFHN